jgi:glycosyltransferase involved in cell wall biosynthesis
VHDGGALAPWRDPAVKFLFDAHHLGTGKTGNETWTRNVVAAMAGVADPGEVVFAVTEAGQAELRRLTQAPSHLVSSHSSHRLLFGLPAVARREHIDAVFATYTAPPTVRPSVVVIHDVSPWHAQAKEWLPLRTRLQMRVTVGASARLSSRVLVLTEEARRDLLDRLSIPPARVAIASAAVDSELAALLSSTVRPAPADSFTVLAVGAVVPRKNLLVLAEAVRSVREAGVPARLRVVGPVPEWGRTIAVGLERLLGPAVQLVGYVSTAELATEYRSADVFCFPSVFEGFGMPILEAMAARTPVVISDSSSLREVAGNAALVCGARDAGAWRDALLRVAADEDLRRRHRQQGSERVTAFSWRRTAEVVLEALRAAGTSG